MRNRLLPLLAAFTLLVALPAASASGSSYTYGQMVDYPMIFPVAADADTAAMWGDWFYAARPNGDHHAQDIMAPKMTPVVAPVAGTIGGVNWSWNPDDLNPDRCCTLTLDHDDGWESWYIHLNNDTPGTDDGLAWGIAEGIVPGGRVEAGQLLGWVGDSGNAEETPPHLHFELRTPDGVIVNPYEALLAAPRISLGETPVPAGSAEPESGEPENPVPQTEVSCLQQTATIIGTAGDDVLIGTEGDDVIHGLAGADVIEGNGGDDLICGGSGNDDIDGGDGDDRVFGNGGRDTIDGGPGADLIKGNRGPDFLHGSEGSDLLVGGGGNDRLYPGDGADVAKGNGGNDRFFGAGGINRLRGGTGSDIVDYGSAPRGVFVDLAAGSGAGEGLDALTGFERAFGSAYEDTLSGNDLDNLLKGRGGDDMLSGSGGDDRLVGGAGMDELAGGDGDDWCSGDILSDCESGPG
jgi:hypothetical protein